MPAAWWTQSGQGKCNAVGHQMEQRSSFSTGLRAPVERGASWRPLDGQWPAHPLLVNEGHCPLPTGDRCGSGVGQVPCDTYPG